MLKSREYRIKIYPGFTGVRQERTIEFINNSDNRLLGCFETSNHKAIERIFATIEVSEGQRESHAKLNIDGLTLEQAYDALYFECIGWETN